jgi:hypothetical protein
LELSILVFEVESQKPPTMQMYGNVVKISIPQIQVQAQSPGGMSLRMDLGDVLWN